MFKKLFLTGLLVIALTAPLWAASATVTSTEYGYSITGGTTATLIASDTWATSTAYTAGQKVVSSGIVYVCTRAHTSGTFATDLATGYWTQVAYATIWVTGITQKANAVTDSTAFTSGASNVSCFSIYGNTSTTFSSINPIQFINLKITLASASDVVYIYVKNTNY